MLIKVDADNLIEGDAAAMITDRGDGVFLALGVKVNFGRLFRRV